MALDEAYNSLNHLIRHKIGNPELSALIKHYNIDCVPIVIACMTYSPEGETVGQCKERINKTIIEEIAKAAAEHNTTTGC